MKKSFYILVSLILTATTSLTYAGTDSSDDAARYYRSYPDKYDGKTIDIDCAFVTRINGGPQIDGIVFFAAHTVDTDNRSRGGSLIVAVYENEAERFMKRYGTAIEINRGQSQKVDTRTLRGTFRQLESGRVYIDEPGDAHEIITANLETARRLIPAEGGSGRSFGKGKKKFG